jgi:hypothetical protein
MVHRAGFVIAARTGAELLDRRGAGGREYHGGRKTNELA